MEQEARRVLSESQLQPDPARLADGWKRRFVTDAARADEAMELYRRLGYEVCADPVDPREWGEECDECYLAALVRFRTIYTRKREAAER